MNFEFRSIDRNRQVGTISSTQKAGLLVSMETETGNSRPLRCISFNEVCHRCLGNIFFGRRSILLVVRRNILLGKILFGPITRHGKRYDDSDSVKG